MVSSFGNTSVKSRGTVVAPLARRFTLAYHHDRWRVILARATFLLLPPLLLGFLMGWHRAGIGATMPKSAALTLWMLNWLVFWWAAEAMLAVARRALKPWTSSEWVMIGAAAIANVALSSVYTPWLMQSVAEAYSIPMPYGPGTVERTLVNPSYLLVLVQACAPGLIIWIGLRRSTFAKVAGPAVDLPRDSDGPSLGEASNACADRLRAQLTKRGEAGLERILALRAQDHYVEVILPDRTVLIFGRLTDAANAFPRSTGLRISRSAWVRLSGISSISPRGEAITLSNGTTVQVARDLRALVKERLADRATF